MCLIERGFFALGISFSTGGAGADDLHLPGSGGGVTEIRLRLNQLALRLNYLLLRGVGIGAGGFDGGCARFGGGGCLIELLLRDFLLGHQLLVAAKVVLGFYVVGLSLLELGFGGVELLPCGLNSGAGAIDIGL